MVPNRKKPNNSVTDLLKIATIPEILISGKFPLLTSKVRCWNSLFTMYTAIDINYEINIRFFVTGLLKLLLICLILTKTVWILLANTAER